MKNTPNNLSVAFDLQPEFPRPFSTIKHLHLRDVMEIPEENPDVEQIITITVNVEIVKTSIIQTVDVRSGDREYKAGEYKHEGRESGHEGRESRSVDFKDIDIEPKDKDTEKYRKRKLEVAGKVHQKIEYVAEFNDKPVYSLNFILPFNTFVVLGEEMEGFKEFEVKGFVRDVLIKLLDKRKIYKNVQLVLTASPTERV